MMKTKVLRKCLFLLSLCLICPVLSTQTMALSEPEPAIPEFTMEELAVIDTATAYLRNAAYADFFYDGREISQRTVLSLSEQERATLSSAAVGCAALRTAEQTADFPKTDISDGSLAAMVSSVELHQKEIAWHAFQNEMRGSDYLYFNSPSYRVNAVSVVGNVALIEVYELLKFQYIELDDYSMLSNNYLISMAKIADDWLVLSIESDDEFYEWYHDTGFDLEGKKDYQLAKFCVENDLTDIDNIDNEQAETTEPRSVVLPENPTTDRTYCPENAKNYALTYLVPSDDGSTNASSYNNNFEYVSNYSCQIFASQCVWAGFGGSNTASEINSKMIMDTSGTDEWWSTKLDSAPSWRSCQKFRDYINNVNASTTESGIVCYTPIEVDPGSEDLLENSNLDRSNLVGAVAHVRGGTSSNPTNLGHAVVITEALGTTRSTVYYTCYTNCRRNIPMDRYYESGEEEYRKIYVIVPRYFRDCNGASENYLYADLQPTLTVGTTKTLCGRAYLANSTLIMTVYKPDGTQYGSTFRATNATAVTGSVTFNTAGLWTVEVSGLGLDTYTFTIRVVSS